MCTFILLSRSLEWSRGSCGISTYLCHISFLETTSNSWVRVGGVSFLLSSFVISSLLKKLPHTDFTVILQSFDESWILISSSAVLDWEGDGWECCASLSSSSCSSLSETDGENVDAELLLLSCRLNSEMKMNKPTKIHEGMKLVCT